MPATNDDQLQADQRLERELAELRQRHDALKEQKVRAEQDLANLRRQLGELRARAEAEYGVSDPAELERLLAERREENRRLVEEYRAHIESVSQGLSRVEESLDDPARS